MHGPDLRPAQASTTHKLTPMHPRALPAVPFSWLGLRSSAPTWCVVRGLDGGVKAAGAAGEVALPLLPRPSIPPPRNTAQMHTKRRISSLVYIASIAGTLVSAMVLHSAILCLVFIIVQTLALLW